MKRGEIWVVTGGGEFLSKPRPAIILQSDQADDLSTVTICPLTTDQEHGSRVRIPIEPNVLNGLDLPSQIMVDRIATVRKARLGRQVGQLSDGDLRQLGHAIVLFLGLRDHAGGR